MGQLETLRDNIVKRFSEGNPVFKADDLSADSAKSFKESLCLDQISFTDYIISDITTGVFSITGKTSVLGIDNFNFKLDLQTSQDGTQIYFTLIPKSPLPASWKLSSSFQTLKGTFFDNLDVTEVYLIVTCFEHSITNPQYSLKNGINLFAKAAPDRALKSLITIDSSITALNLSGIITRSGTDCNVELKASVNEIQTTLSAPVLILKHDSSAAEENKDNAQIKGVIKSTEFSFDYNVNIPVILNPLYTLMDLLESRLKDGNLVINDSDLGDAVSVKFFNSVWKHDLSFTQASVNMESEQLIIKGKTSVFGLPAETDVTITVIYQNDQFEFTLICKVHDEWKIADAFPQVQNSFFETVTYTNGTFIATSYSHNILVPDTSVVSGLNFYAETGASGTLNVITALENISQDFSIIGIISKQNDIYNISLSHGPFADIVISSPGFKTITIKSPVLYLESYKTDDVFVNRAVMRGSVCTSVFSDYPGVFIIPVNSDQRFWLLNMDKDYIDLPSINKLLGFSGQDSLASVFPDNFKALDNLKISKIDMMFVLKGNRIGSVYTEISLKPNDDGTPREFEFLASPKISFLDLRFGYGITYYSYDQNNKSMTFTCVFSGVIKIGSVSSIKSILKVIPSADWYLTVLPDNVTIPTLSDIATLIWPIDQSKGSQDILNVLPSGLIKGPQINISEIEAGFNPLAPSFSFISFLLEQQGAWEITSFFKFTSWKISMMCDVKDSVKITGFLNGDIKIGTDDNPIAIINMKLPIPAGEQGWTVSLKENSTFTVPTLKDILGLIGGEKFTNNIPAGLGNLGGLTVETLGVNFVPSPAKLNWFKFSMYSTEEWVIIENILSFNHIIAQLNLTVNQTNSYDMTGLFSCVVSVASIPIRLESSKSTPQDNWNFIFGIQEPVHIPGLAQLAEFMMPSTIISYIPEAFMPFKDGFDINDLNVKFNITGKTLDNIGFSIKNSGPWNILPGYFSVDGAQVKADIDFPFQDTQKYLCLIDCDLSIGDVEIHLRASHDKADTEWILAGGLVQEKTFNIEKSLSQVLPEGISMPYYYGFPRQITIKKLDLSITTQTGKFHFDFDSTFDWSISFGLCTGDKAFKIKEIGAKLDVEPKEQETRPYVFNVHGDFAFFGINADLNFTTSNKKDKDTILAAVITPEEVNKISLEDISDGLSVEEQTGQGNNPPSETSVKWTNVIPVDFLPGLEFKEAYIGFNLTKNILFVYGSIKGFGNIVFLTKKQSVSETETKWGYAFGLTLGNDFKFANLCSALSVIDGILKVNKAGLLLTSFEQNSTTIESDIKSVQSLSYTPQDFTLPVPQDLKDTKLTKGVIFYADFDIKSSSLFGTIMQIGQEGQEFANIKITGLIDHANSINTFFEADLPDITILNTIRFTHTDEYSGIHLKYQPNNKNQFDLNGRITIQNIFSKDYSFDGALTVNEEKIDSTLELYKPDPSKESSIEPFGMPGISLKELKLGIIYKFKTETTPKSTCFYIKGSVKFATLDFTGTLYLADGTPALASVVLNSDLSIGMFFNQCIPGYGWPTDFIDLTFEKDSRIYYYDKSKDTAGQLLKDGTGYEFQDGFNISSTIKVTIIVPFEVPTTVQVKSNGIILRTGLRYSINLGFIEFAGSEKEKNKDGTEKKDGKYINSPQLDINTIVKNFALTTGINFLGTTFIIVSVGVSFADEQTKLTGELKYQGKLGPFTDPDWRFSYCEKDGFKVENLPDFTFLNDAINAVKYATKTVEEVAELISTAGCGEIVQTIADRSFETTFSASPCFASENGKLELKITLSVHLKVAGSDALKPVKFPSDVITVLYDPAKPSDFISWDHLKDAITGSVEATAADFARALQQDTEQMALFLVMAVAPEALKAVASELLCMGLKAAIDAGLAAITDAVAKGASIAAAVAAGAGAVIAFIASGGGGSEDPDPDIPDKSKYGLAYADNKITATWSGASRASGYEFELWSSDNTTKICSATTDYNGRSASVPLSGSLPAGNYTGKLRSTRGKKYSDWVEKNIGKLAPPTGLNITYSSLDNAINVAWDTGTAPSGYDILLFDDNGQISSTHEAQNSATFNLPSSYTGLIYAKVRASGSSSEVPSEFSKSDSIRTLSAPSGVTVSFNNTAKEFTINWNITDGVAGYIIELFTGNTIAVTKTALASDTQIKISLTEFTGIASEYKARVKASGDSSHISSSFGISETSVMKLSAAGIITLSLDKTRKKIIGSWNYNNKTGLSGFEIKLLDKADKSVVTSVNKEVPATLPVTISCEFDYTSFITENPTEYVLSVKAIGGENTIDSDTIESATEIIRLGKPVITEAGYDTQTGSYTTKWSQVVNANKYNCILNDCEKGSDILQKQTDALEISFTENEIQNGFNSIFKTGITAQAGDNAIDSVQILTDVLPIPPVTLPLLNLSNDNNQITAAWTITETRTCAYELVLFDSDQKQVGAIVKTYDNSTTFVLTDVKNNSKYSVKIREAYKSYTSQWSAGYEITVHLIPPPQTLNLQYNDGKITASWSSVIGADSYDFELIDPNGNIVSGIQQGIKSTSIIMGDGITFTEGATYTAKVRSVKQGFPGAWSNTASVTIPQKETSESLAVKLKSQGKSAEQAAPLIKQAFPDLKAEDMADLIIKVFQVTNKKGWNLAGSSDAMSLMEIPVMLNFNGKVWAMAGQYQNSVYNSDDCKTWNLVMQNAPWSGRRSSAGVVFNNKMWIMGGDCTGTSGNDIWNSTDGKAWNQITGSAQWPKRMNHGAVVFKGKMWVFGGGDFSGNVYNDVWNSLDGSTWTRVTQNAGWSPRDSFGFAVFDDKIWVFGGSYGGNAIQDVWYSADGANWTKAALPPWEPRFGANVEVINDTLYLMGGVSSGAQQTVRGDLWCMDKKYTWTKSTDPIPWTGLRQEGSVVFNNMIWLIGGDLNLYGNTKIWNYSPVDYYDIDALKCAKCLKAASYSMVESSPSIKKEYPEITAAQLTDILMQVFD